MSPRNLPLRAGAVAAAACIALLPKLDADTVGHWRFDAEDAEAGAVIGSVANAAAEGGDLDAAPANGTPLYSDDVPAAEILDPVSGSVLPNLLSFDASGANARLSTIDSEDWNTSFTVEFFIKVVGEPGGYQAFLRRQQVRDLRWQVDFDHGANLNFGRIRGRWDTPAGAPDDVADQEVDENVNFVLGAAGGATAPKLYVDTGAKDELGADVGEQNTGDPRDYVFDSESANPNEADCSLQGDGSNDDESWHHCAMTFDDGSGEIALFFDYVLAQRRTLSDSEGDGYTHPAAGIEFGKFAGQDYELFIDELRFSNAILTPGQFLRDASIGGAESVAHWRMDGAGAEEGAAVETVANALSPLHSATVRNGSPTYSSDIPAPTIFDPLNGTFLINRFSLDCSGGNARIGTDGDEVFDSSFTVEMFVKLIDEPGGYHTFLRRREQSDLRWQIDFDHGNRGAFGRPRCRWDTPAGGVPDNMATNGVDENFNFVVGPTGGVNVPEVNRLFIDTDAGDGLLASYDDPSDWSLDGDGINDVAAWRHVAMTFDQGTGAVGFYLDGELMQLRILSDSEGNGYTHPAGAVEFGKFANAEYGLLIDEVRYSSSVLFPEQFLQAVNAPPQPFAITDAAYDADNHVFTLEFRAEPGATYSVDRWDEDFDFWQEVDDDVLAEGDSVVYEDATLPPGLERAIYRVRESE